MASSELQKRKQEEYEMQLFNFHSRAVYATLKNIVSERIHYTIQKMCETIEKTYKLNSENVAILETNQKNLERAYYKGTMPHLENIKNIVNKYIAIPSNVLLEEDKYQRTQYSDTEFENINRTLEVLQQRAKRATVLNTVLKEELRVLEEFPITEENVNKMCNIIENNVKCPNVNEKMYHLVEDYKNLSTSLFDTITTKMKYNPVDNLKCKEIDLNSL
ncbi:PREDICTED: protein MIS12 homolog [Eufriesea mexicana]|nr:PREDICTED: protein MIS12 homolog [Eufriesea mexicana]